MGLVFVEIHSAGAASFQSILSMRDRADTIDRLVNERLTTLPEQLMRREGIDIWVLVAREYNEDPVVMTMLPGTAHSARRRTILVFV
ncbi:Xaa-Pro aminopeptidase, partial [Gammaproteobacteria bacterium]|nr:Xaa-Pro aminopeptidase [Gammaproteobacteria bacterium]